MKCAYVTFIIRNDSFLPGALVLAYALKLQKTKHDLVCIVSNNLTKRSIDALEVLYDHVVVLDEIYVEHKNRHERQDRPFLFSRFSALRLGKNGDLGFDYDKVLICDADLLPLHDFDSLFELNAPADIINEYKEHCMDYKDGKYVYPYDIDETEEWIWHKIYKDVPHGTLIPKEITDRINEDKDNMGVNASLYLLKPDIELYNDILKDLDTIEVVKEISTYKWPEMQYITVKLSGLWTNIDLKYSSFNGYPKVSVLNGIHLAGLKPWSIKNKSIKSFSKFEDYQLWYHTFFKVLDSYRSLQNHKKLIRIRDFLLTMHKENNIKLKVQTSSKFNHFYK